VQVSISGHNLPGRSFCSPDGSPMTNVHVGIQLRRDPAELVPADATDARWVIAVETVQRDGQFDFRGPAVQGSRGDRFIYLTWGNVDPSGHFHMFRRAKLMLNRIDQAIVGSALETDQLLAKVDLTGNDGGPRCARVDPPAIEWSALPR
jgi:Family of unknown function (DUF5990)